jgi:hypothetical protein
MARGRRPDCHCFGKSHSEPIGWPTLGRNLALVIIAGMVVSQGHVDSGGNVLGWLELLTVGERIVLAGTLVCLLLGFVAWLLIQILAQQGRQLLRLDEIESRFSLDTSPFRSKGFPADPSPPAGLPMGQPAPEFRPRIAMLRT